MKLYTIESLLSTRDMTLEMACCRLSAHEAVKLASISSNAKILVALKSIKPYKALGLDGLHAGFFQRHWNCVGDSVKEEVRNIFLSCEMPAFLNQTLITLNRISCVKLENEEWIYDVDQTKHHFREGFFETLHY